MLRNVNERNAQMQKQLENVVREGKYSVRVCFRTAPDVFLFCFEANSELGLLNNKLAGELFSQASSFDTPLIAGVLQLMSVILNSNGERPKS